jgi:hypothetical protein
MVRKCWFPPFVERRTRRKWMRLWRVHRRIRYWLSTFPVDRRRVPISRVLPMRPVRPVVGSGRSCRSAVGVVIGRRSRVVVSGAQQIQGTAQE